MNVQEILTDRQKQGFKLLCQPTQMTALYGGSRSGKTFDIAVWLFLICILRKSRHLILRKHLSTLISSMWYDTLPKALEIMGIPANAYRFRGDRHFITFANGSEIWLYGLDNSQRSDKILGNEYSTIWINEASEFDAEIIPVLMSRLAQNTGIKNKMILDFNPPETSHWTYDLIMNSSLGEGQIKLNHILMNPGDNLQNLPEDYLKLLETMPERQRKRFLEGIFVSPDEAIFTESMIKWRDPYAHYSKVVIGIDPAVTEKVTSDETGINVQGRFLEDGVNKNIKLEDLSMKGSPEAWGLRAVDAYLRYKPISRDIEIVAEVNQGGDMVGSVINKIAQQKGVKVNYHAVRTSVSKQYRAEEFSIMLATQPWFFNQKHDFKSYIKQFLGYTSMLQNKRSPDRIDAAIIAASRLSTAQRALLYYSA